jgi:hypothetical protein
VRIIRSPPAAVAGQESAVQYPITQVEKFPPFRWNKMLFFSVADPGHFGVDPNSSIFVINLEDANKKPSLKVVSNGTGGGV